MSTFVMPVTLQIYPNGNGSSPALCSYSSPGIIELVNVTLLHLDSIVSRPENIDRRDRRNN